MKPFLFVILFLVSFTGFSQDNHIVKTEDGRRVLLKADFTWEYIDLEKPKDFKPVEVQKAKSSKNNACDIAEDFEEPKLDNKVQTQLKKGRATLDHIKKRVAKDFNCTVEDVKLLYIKENKKTGVYDFCANGTKVTYKRTGHSFAKKIKVF